MKRRFFFKAGAMATFTGILPNSAWTETFKTAEISEIDWDYAGKVIKPNDEALWQRIGDQFPRNKKYIQLENGYFSHQAIPVLQYHHNLSEQINEEHSIFMRISQESTIEHTRKILAQFQGCSSEEIAFTRNTTESLNIVIMGFPWGSGDEVVIGNQDYGSMVEAFEQIKVRFGVKIKVAQVPMNDTPDWEDRCVKAYTEHITRKTRMVHLTHPINLNGQGIPLKQIINRIKQINHNICIVVDAAHALSHFPDTLGSMNADVVGSSLHKWTGAPLGLGCLYVRQEYIAKIWPLFGDSERPKNDIRKFEHQGTRPIQTIQSLEKAIDTLQRIGIENRRNRLIYLKYLWQGNKSGLKDLSKSLDFELDDELIHMLTDLTQHSKVAFLHPLRFPKYQGAISTFHIKDIKATDIANELKETYNIFTVAINHPIIQGVRITPQLSNTVKDVVHLNQSIHKIATK
jgi:selenocysteine lyase/cysteine desulfurase